MLPGARTNSGAEGILMQVDFGRSRRRLVLVCAGVSAAAGAAALFGWLLGLPVLARIVAGYLPMAPSTALVLLLYSAIVSVDAGASAPGKRWVNGLRVGGAGLGVLTSLALLTLSMQGVYLEIERLGLHLPDAAGTHPVGHMSPATALCLAIAGLALAILPRDGQRRRLRWSLGLAAVLVVAAGVMLLAYLFGAPVLYTGPFIPPAATTVVALLALGIALAGSAWSSGQGRQTGRSGQSGLLLGFLVLSAAIICSGLFSYQHYERRYRAAVERQLAAVAGLKADELVQWRRERLGDAALLAENAAFAALVRRFFEEPAGGEAQRQLESWFAGYGRYSQYERVSLLDATGRERLAARHAAGPLHPHLAEDAREVMRSGAAIFLDLHRHREDAQPRLGVAAPVFDDRDRNRVLGAVVLGINPTTYLYPFLSRWPTPSSTAETLLVRREGEEVLFLSDLRFRPESALSLRLPLLRTDMPAVAAARGRTGIVEGPDYRGVPVLADVRPVPGSPWHLVARMDLSEIYAPLRERLWLTVALIAALLAGVGGASELLWRRHTANLYRERLAAERERNWLQAVISRSLNEIYVFDAATLRFTFVNDGALRNLGYTLDELLRMTPLDLEPRFEAERFERLLLPLRSGETPLLNFETAHRRKDGSEYPVEAHLQRIDSERGPVFLAVVNDVTRRARTDAELRERNAELERFIYTVSHDLKSPLVTIKSFLGYLRQDLARGNQERVAIDLEYLRNAAAKMGALLDDLLEMSRVGRVAAEPVESAFEELAAEAVSLVAGAIAGRGVRVRILPAAVTLRGDRARLVEIWQNLVENAVKFMGEQTDPRVEIGAERRGAEVVFFVRDNGQGIEARYRERIFGLFERLDPNVEGTGLGLALVKRIVELHGGAIRAESAGPGHGATFSFTLPGALVPPAPGLTAP